MRNYPKLERLPFALFLLYGALTGCIWAQPSPNSGEMLPNEIRRLSIPSPGRDFPAGCLPQGLVEAHSGILVLETAFCGMLLAQADGKQFQSLEPDPQGRNMVYNAAFDQNGTVLALSGDRAVILYQLPGLRKLLSLAAISHQPPTTSGDSASFFGTLHASPTSVYFNTLSPGETHKVPKKIALSPLSLRSC